MQKIPPIQYQHLNNLWKVSLKDMSTNNQALVSPYKKFDICELEMDLEKRETTLKSFKEKHKVTKTL